MTQGTRHVLRKACLLLFWLLTLASLLVVSLFAYAAILVLVANVQGGHARMWFLGDAGYVVFAAAVHLLLAIALLVKKYSHGTGPRT